jgi:pilus assembly protein CpaB
MRGGRLFIVLALVLLIVLVGAWFVVSRVLPNLQPSTPTATAIQVYYAGQPIAKGTTISEDLLQPQPVPNASAAESMYTLGEAADLIGQTALIDIELGKPIFKGMVGDSAPVAVGGPAWANLIDPSKTAITIPTSRLASVGYGVADGARVNVIACMLVVDVDPSYQTILPNHVGALVAPAGMPPSGMPGITITVNNTAPQVAPYQGRTEVESAFQQGIYIVASEPQRPRPVCQMIMQNIQVLKLGNFPLNAASVAANAATPTPQAGEQVQPTSTPAPDIVTLVVSPQEAVVLTYMGYTNTPLYLTLRNGNDGARFETESATLQFLLSQFNITIPVKLAFSLTPRVDVLSLPFLPNDVLTVTPEQ